MIDANGAIKSKKVAIHLPDIRQLAKGSPLAMLKAAKLRFIAENVLFINDIRLICKESVSLAKEISGVLRCDWLRQLVDCLRGGEIFILISLRTNVGLISQEK
ncbi:hypothetical protein MHYP_G00146440 [Metynnis hypsauchen]